MSENVLARIFEHNTWANLQILQVCSTLTDEQLDAQPVSTTRGSIRRTLEHLIDSEQYYLYDLTGVRPLFDWQSPPPFAELREAAQNNGKIVQDLVRDADSLSQMQRLLTQDKKYYVDPWVIFLQIVNHATEHREQIKSMLTALGIKTPDIDGWDFGEAVKAMVPASAVK